MKFSTSLLSLLAFIVLLTTAQGSDLYFPLGEGTLPEKLIVTDMNAMIYDDFSKVGASVPPLTILWRLTVDGNSGSDQIVSRGDKKYYHVGGPDGKHWGYIDVNSVTSWMTRFVYVPLPPSSDRLFVVYDQPFSSKVFYSKDAASLEKSVIATIKEIPDGFGSFAFVLNDKGGKKDKDLGIDPNEFKKVLIYNTPISKEGQTSYYNEKPTQSGPSPDDIGLDIVFVIDTTASMTPLIELAKHVCKTIANDIHNDPTIAKKVHFGLVDYRDSQYCSYGARVDCNITASYDEFMSALNALGELEGSTDVPEDVILGLRTAVDKISWNELTAKHIIILGDSQNKPTAAAGKINTFPKLYNYTNKDTARNVTQNALKYIRFSAICGEDYGITLSEFKEIANNQGDRKGFFAIISDPNVSQNLVTELKNGFYALKTDRSALSSVKSSSGSGVFADSVWDLKEMLSNSQSGAGVFGNKVVGFASARTNLDTKCADLNIMILRNEMKNFHDQLDQAYSRLDKLITGKGGNIKVIFDNFLEHYVGIASGTATDADYDMDLATILDLQMPVKTKTLKLSIREVMRMSDRERLEWMHGIKEAIDRTQAILDKKEAWIDTFQKSDSSQSFAFISVADLP